MVNNVTTYEVDVWPDQIPPFMRTGMTSNVVFNVSEKDDVLVIPADALQQVNGQTGVMLAGEKGGKPQFTVIQTGVTDGKKVEVVSGLAEGDKVLIKSFSASQYTPQGASNNPLMPGAGPGGNRGGGGGGH
jgi:multidrug efflux pump subunit AcrA (membrane-fusion protein)